MEENIILKKYNIQDKEVFFYCDEILSQEADFLAELLEQEQKKYHILGDGKILCFGWNYYKVVCVEDKYQILAVDLKGNPFSETVEDLTLNLEIFGSQLKVIKKTGVIPVHVTFQDTMIVRKTALHASEFYLQRLEPVSQDDSGWYMGALDDTDSDEPTDYVRIYTYQLLSICKEALSVLQLPVDTIAVFENGTLMEIVDGDNQPLL